MQDYVEVTNLVKQYGDFCAVDHLSFGIEKGEIFGLLGPNGAGKSTTLHVITTLNQFEGGSVRIGTLDLAKDKVQIRKMVGVVPQEIALYRHLTAYENVAFFASLYGLSGKDLKEAVITALAFVGLSDKAKMKPKQMSGGMQRRLNIACGIAHKPELIVMDEPTVGVDAQSREHILNTIRILKAQGSTIIYTSHYMQEVEAICDHIAIMDHGKLVASGTKDELISLVTEIRPVRITTSLLSEAKKELVIKEIRVMPGVVRIRAEENCICLDLSVKCTNIMPILQRVAQCDLPVIDVVSEYPNLDTTFLCLTGNELR